MSREDVEAAVREIRREGLKAAVLHAVVESTVVFFVALAALTFTGFEYGLLGYSFVYPLAFAAAAVFLVVDAYLLYRRRTVEYFEEINPDVRERLRTARDAAEDGAGSPAAEALYAELLDGLSDTSSHGFVDGRRLATGLLIVLAGGVFLMAGGVDEAGTSERLQERFGFGEAAVDGSTVESGEQEYRGLQSGDHLIGEPGNYTEDDEELLIRLRGGGAPRPGDLDGDSYYSEEFEAMEVERAAAVELYTGGSAELDEDERLLVREYFLRSREGG